MILALDSSPLITLARIDRLSLLQTLAQELFVPEAVFEEVMTLGRERPDTTMILQAAWLIRKPVRDRVIVSRLRGRLGRGEAEAIALAKENPETLVVLDDATARRMAKEEGVHVVGTVGLIILAKGKGIVPTIQPILSDMKDNGFYLDDALVQLALRAAGE